MNCQHTSLQFGSGDYYVMCTDCHAVWMRRGDRAEYGTDASGKEIGADPSKCQSGFDMVNSGTHRLVAALEMARTDLKAACTYVEHHERSAAHGLRQSLAKIDAVLPPQPISAPTDTSAFRNAAK